MIFLSSINDGSYSLLDGGTGQNTEVFKMMVESAPDPIFIQIDKKFAYLNPAACEFFGIDSPAELIGTPILDSLSPEHKIIVAERIRQLNEDREIGRAHV